MKTRGGLYPTESGCGQVDSVPGTLNLSTHPLVDRQANPGRRIGSSDHLRGKDDCMPRKEIVVHCEFSESGKTLTELLEESFRFYLRQILAQDGGNSV